MRSARTCLLTSLIALTSGFATSACSDDAKRPGGTAAGGSAADGAVPGTGGALGGGGLGGAPGLADGPAGSADGSANQGDAAATCKVPCLANIGADCIPEGTCIEQPGLLGLSNLCYANGVKVLTTLVPLPPGAVVTHRKANGSLCYSVEGSITANMVTLTWKDAAGVAVATGVYDTQTKVPTVTCGTQSFGAADLAGCAAGMNLPSVPGSATGAPATMCTQGSCM